MTTKTICSTDISILDELLGTSVIVRSVTHYYVGVLSAYDDSLLLLDDAAWVADTGRWSVALSTGAVNEVEPYPGKCILNRGAIVDLSPWNHSLLRTTK